jgi:outer membrane receptor protein involved in Fe transport
MRREGVTASDTEAKGAPDSPRAATSGAKRCVPAFADKPTKQSAKADRQTRRALAAVRLLEPGPSGRPPNQGRLTAMLRTTTDLGRRLLDAAARACESPRASRLLSTSVIALAAGLGWAGSEALAADEGESAERIIVTGSRVERTGFNSPNPLTVMDSQLTDDLGIVNVGDTLRRLPQNTAFFTETNVGIGNFNVGAQLANLRGLNPFFGTRTLTLVDTKRVVPNSEGGAVDITLIPSLLVGRTEVVTGGASAAYGSDAIAGVVNVILDTDLEGWKAQFDYGQTFQGDGADTHAGIAFGANFAEGRGHVMLGGEFQTQDPIAQCSRARDWCAEGWMVGTNNGFAGGNGLPNRLVLPNAKLPTSNTGLLTPFGGVALQFNDAGTELRDYTPGTFGGLFSASGGDGDILAYDHSNIRPDLERYSVLGRVDYELTGTLSVFAELAHAHSESANFPANGALGPIARVIAPDNAFLTPDVLAVAPAGGIFNRTFMPDVVSANNTTENDTIRFVAGLEGDLGGDWNWDAYYQYGHNENSQRLFHNAAGGLAGPPPVFDFVGWAIDAVHTDPMDPTSPIACRATLPGPGFNPLAEGCVPLNLFGRNNASPAAVDYAYRTLVEDAEYDQNVLGANVRGTLFNLPAGPISAAGGVEWRKDENKATHDEDRGWTDAFFLSWGLDRGGEIEVVEGYGEVDIPLLRNQPFARALDVNLAARYTRSEATSATSDDSASHEFESWKASGIYDVNDWVRFRGTLSRDVRAAGFRELFLPRDTSLGVPGSFPAGISNPWTGLDEEYELTTGGNSDLAPETADTTTLGVVLSPGGALDGFRFSVDWFEIDLQDAITPGGLGGLSAQNLVDACQRGGLGACAAITGVSDGMGGFSDITAVEATSINIGKFLTRGFDIEASYDMPMSRLHEDWVGDLNLRVLASNLYEMTVDTGLGDAPIDYHGQTGPVASFGGFNTSPDWRANAWLTYRRDRFSTTLEAQYIGEGTLNATWFDSPIGAASNTQINSIDDNSVDSAVYYALSASYEFDMGDDARSVEVFGVINNLFGEDPPVAPGGNLYPTNPVYFDTIGARFRAGVRLRF